VLPVELLEEISFIDKEVKINLPKEEIKNAPEYKASDEWSTGHEQEVYAFFGNKIRK
jgi:hypothetical protein